MRNQPTRVALPTAHLRCAISPAARADMHEELEIGLVDLFEAAAGVAA